MIPGLHAEARLPKLPAAYASHTRCDGATGPPAGSVVPARRVETISCHPAASVPCR